MLQMPHHRKHVTVHVNYFLQGHYHLRLEDALSQPVLSDVVVIIHYLDVKLHRQKPERSCKDHGCDSGVYRLLT